MELEWEEPPPAALVGGHRGRYEEVADELRKHPERWAVLPNLGGSGGARSEKGARATAQNIRAGKVKGFVKGQFEAACDGVKVWVRYTPSDSDGAEDQPEPDLDGPPRPSAARVREWAQQQGLKVPERGRLPQEIYDRYSAADMPRPSLRVAKDDGDDPWREDNAQP